MSMQHQFFPPRSGCGKVGNSQHFPTSLHSLLDEAERGNYEHVVSWCSNGTAFKIHNKDALVPLLAKHFRQTKFKSFLRQLQCYEFKRISRGADKGIVSHPFFVRGRRSLCIAMGRKPSVAKGTVPTMTITKTKLSLSSAPSHQVGTSSIPASTATAESSASLLARTGSASSTMRSSVVVDGGLPSEGRAQPRAEEVFRYRRQGSGRPEPGQQQNRTATITVPTASTPVIVDANPSSYPMMTEQITTARCPAIVTPTPLSSERQVRYGNPSGIHRTKRMETSSFFNGPQWIQPRASDNTDSINPTLSSHSLSSGLPQQRRRFPQDTFNGTVTAVNAPSYSSSAGLLQQRKRTHQDNLACIDFPLNGASSCNGVSSCFDAPLPSQGKEYSVHSSAKFPQLDDISSSSLSLQLMPPLNGQHGLLPNDNVDCIDSALNVSSSLDAQQTSVSLEPNAIQYVDYRLEEVTHPSLLVQNQRRRPCVQQHQSREPSSPGDQRTQLYQQDLERNFKLACNGQDQDVPAGAPRSHHPLGGQTRLDDGDELLQALMNGNMTSVEEWEIKPEDLVLVQ